MSVDLTFEANSEIGWQKCAAGGEQIAWALAICPLCKTQFKDPLFVDFVREQYEKHLLEHALRGEPHEMGTAAESTPGAEKGSP